jgi:hypothetical protein
MTNEQNPFNYLRKISKKEMKAIYKTMTFKHRISNWFIGKLSNILGKTKFRDKTVHLIPKYLRKVLISYLTHNDTVCLNVNISTKKTIYGGTDYFKPENGDLLLTSTVKILDTHSIDENKNINRQFIDKSKIKEKKKEKTNKQFIDMIKEGAKEGFLKNNNIRSVIIFITTANKILSIYPDEFHDDEDIVEQEINKLKDKLLPDIISEYAKVSAVPTFDRNNNKFSFAIFIEHYEKDKITTFHIDVKKDENGILTFGEEDMQDGKIGNFKDLLKKVCEDYPELLDEDPDLLIK